MASEFFATPLRRDQPLWEMRLVEGLSDGRTAHLAKVHHCMVDGVAGVALLAALLDTTPETRYVRERARETSPLPGPLTLLTNAVFDRAIDRIRLNEQIALNFLHWQAPAEGARSIARALAAAGPYFAARAPKTPWNMPLHSPSRVAWAVIPFEDAHAAARALGGTVNDLALTVISEGLRRYLEQEGVETKDLVLRAGLPVSVRGEGDALGNRVSFMLAGLPVSVRDPRERFARISGEVSELKQKRQANGIEQLMERLGDLPPVVHAVSGRTPHHAEPAHQPDLHERPGAAAAAVPPGAPHDAPLPVGADRLAHGPVRGDHELRHGVVFQRHGGPRDTGRPHRHCRWHLRSVRGDPPNRVADSLRPDPRRRHRKRRSWRRGPRQASSPPHR